MLSYSFTPVQEIHNPLLDKAGVRLLIKREDLNHPLVSGNKWWKLKYNLEEAVKLEHKTIVTFGGAYSNHTYATAAAAHELGLSSIGIIRGEETLPLNSTLSFATSKGMKLHYISREKYRTKTESSFINELQHAFGNFYLMPEGGTNELAVKSVTEFAQTLGHDFDYLCCAVGTGGTLAGLISGVPEEKTIIGFPVLKGGEFLNDDIKNLLEQKHTNWKLATDYHFGGYAKATPQLINFVKGFREKHNIPLDLIYTGKMFFGIMDLINKGFFPKRTTILAIHSGGLQNKN